MKQWSRASSIIEAYIRKCFLNLINPSIQTLQTLSQPKHEERVKHAIAFVLNRGEEKKTQYVGTNSQTEKQLSNRRKMMGSLTWPGF